jgi:adenylate cyclase
LAQSTPWLCYIGDAAIVTWPLARGIKDARCVRCVFDILSDIDADAAAWKHRFGEVPRLRAALHGGPIVTAEIGVDHHKVAFFGDTINTTARIEALCKTLGRSVLISSELASKVALPKTIAAESLGEHVVKGRGQTLGVTALSAHGSTTNQLQIDSADPGG